MFSRVLTTSLRRSKSRVGVLVLAALLAGSLVTALVSLSFGVERKAGRQLRAYGANIILSAAGEAAQPGVGNLKFGPVAEPGYLDESRVTRALDAAGRGEIAGAAPYLDGSVTVLSTQVSVAGVRFAQVKQVSPWWQVSGAWAEDPVSVGPSPATGPQGEVAAMIGTKIARELKLGVDDVIEVRAGDRTERLRIVGLVETGAAEDLTLFLPLLAAQRILDLPGLVSRVELSASAGGRSLASIAAELDRAIPGSQADVVGQIAQAESQVLQKVRLLVGLVAVLVLVSAGLAVANTMTASVMERTKEIGLLKALGAERPWVAALFFGEAIAAGLVGAFGGYLLGAALAALIGRLVFSAAIPPSIAAVPVTIVVTVGMGVLASLLPVRRALAVDPALTLRGE
ncbi:MAG: FtsX-like permease family protein [Actinobacteria bacterium]|nr:FtsX-like permease family protein [Actinomycetota bacterium]